MKTININEFVAKTFDNILSKEECDYIVNFCNSTSAWRRISNSFWDNRTINYSNVEDENIKKIISINFLKIQKLLKDEYNLQSDVYTDIIDIVRWFPGMEQLPHCDDMSDNIDQHIRFKNRYFGSVIYLNDDFSGGVTFYPEHNFKIVPKIGTLAVHLGDYNHRHGVTKIEKSIRYTISSFWSFNKNMKYDIFK